jgi:hypothetical protein
MTARTVVAASSLVLALGATACMDFYEVPVDVPIQAKLDVSMFKRVLSRGFSPGARRRSIRTLRRLVCSAVSSAPSPT